MVECFETPLVFVELNLACLLDGCLGYLSKFTLAFVTDLPKFALVIPCFLVCLAEFALVLDAKFDPCRIAR
jgi:hypothetical protein